MTAAEAGAPTCARLSDGLALALDRRVTCRLERQAAGVRLESKQALARVEGERLADLRVPQALVALRELLLAAGLDEGVSAVLQTRVPAETGLSPDLAEAVAAAAAALCLSGGGVPAPEAVADLIDRALRRSGEVAVDSLALWTALRGGCQLRAGTQVRTVAVDPAWVEQWPLLVDLGVPARPRAGGPGSPEGDERLAAALVARDERAVPALLDAAWRAACAADARLVTPEADEALGLALAAGGAGRPCAAGGGGLLLLWVPIDTRAGLVERLRQSGRRVYPCRVDVLGLDAG